MTPSSIKNLLFDLGGVILDIDLQATKKRLYDLGLPAIFMQYPENMQTDLFFKYETGKINTGQFMDELRRLSGLELENKVIAEAWIAMLGGVPKARTDKLARLKERYRLFLLSNTCELHVPVFEMRYLETAGRSMHEDFEKVYYSSRIGAHKPNKEAWEYVLKDAGIKARETLFLDDNIHNIKAAQALGFQAIHIHERTQLTDLGFDL
ncbi:MAG: HAD family phosphatase [Bacteroidales bacterium]